MPHLARNVFLSLAALAAAAGLEAQTVVVAGASNGPFVGLPTLFSASAGTAGLASPDSAAEGWFKDSGFDTAPPVPLDPSTSAAVPDFSAKALFRDPCGLGASAVLPDVDAVSLGLDWITVGSGGFVRVPPGHWAGIVFSVTQATAGKHGQVAGETRRKDSYAKAGADLFSYFYRGSAIPPNFVDVSQRSNDATEVRLRTDGEVDALDIYAPLYRLAIDAGLRLPAKARFYFSVSAATVKDVPPAWWKNAAGKVLPSSGATVFESTWDRATKKWSCPRAFFAPADLGLANGEDIDAFSFDRIQFKVLLSTKTRTRDPILYVDFGKDAAVAVPVTYTDAAKTLVSDRTGLDLGKLDDVDAICSVDPGPTQGVRLDLVLGRPLVVAIPPMIPLVHVQAWRDVDASNLRRHFERLWVAGGDAGGFGILLFRAPRGPWFAPFAPFQIPARSPFHGQPLQVPLAFPAKLGVQFETWWLTLPRRGLFPFKLGVPQAVHL